ncbi:hypothetical protein BCR43DRAFT_495229 [Syncephalastrum racemosum]|uniref:Uncharacterized protein n=1 Tax=Syncephalastrum racemosum TaxID=13706 RepID=A0A1X2H5K1_SYNRA|nr:hypothetical protein BCR43DRAFT_495229 [Syncephalastrum racemosum]
MESRTAVLVSLQGSIRQELHECTVARNSERTAQRYLRWKAYSRTRASSGAGSLTSLLAYIRALQAGATSAHFRSFYNANTVKRKWWGVSRSIRSALDSLSNLILLCITSHQ